MKVYGDRKSGNCYKVQLVCALLAIDYEWIDIDIMAGETRKKKFLKKNPAGKIPLLELTDGRLLSESNVIINYLAYGSDLLPRDAFEMAKVMQWQSFEQYSHEPYIAVNRFIAKYQDMPKERRAQYDANIPKGYDALKVMEKQLQETDFLMGRFLTTADISLYAYTHVADEGGFSLDDYPAIRAWIERIEDFPRFVSMKTFSESTS